jgi:anti-sigma factor RsiW
MSDCRRKSEIEAHHDGETPLAERADLDAHIRQCIQCAEELQRLERLSSLFAESNVATLSPEGMAHIRELVGPSSDTILFRWAGGLTAAAAAVLFLCSLWLWGAADRPGTTRGIPDFDSHVVARPLELADANGAGGDIQLAYWIADDLSKEW